MEKISEDIVKNCKAKLRQKKSIKTIVSYLFSMDLEEQDIINVFDQLNISIDTVKNVLVYDFGLDYDNVMALKSKPKPRKYVVVVNGYYVRDVQVMRSDKDINDEETMCDEYEIDANWKDCCHPDLYLGIYSWNPDNKDSLISYVAAKHGYNKEIVAAYEC